MPSAHRFCGEMKCLSCRVREAVTDVGSGAMETPTVFIVRHGEKPAGKMKGIDKQGTESEHSLTTRGWQRAGALVSLFGASASSEAKPPLGTPAFIFAASPDAPGADPKEKSRREEETAAPLAARLGLKANIGYGKGDEAKVAKAARACTGPVVIVWDHETIPQLAREFSGSSEIPDRWPKSRYDLVFVLQPSAQPSANGYRFSQMPQQLLAGDSDTVDAE